MVAITSVFLAAGILFALKVRSIVGVGTALLWIPISLFLLVYSARFKPPTLKKWKERTHKSLNGFTNETGLVHPKFLTTTNKCRRES
jgi:hypothetical protein